MGNEQSQGLGSSVDNSNVSSSFSFLARRTQNTPSPIVVVNSRGQTVGDPNDDEDLKKLKEISRFQPILKGVLPGHRDPQSIFTKIDPKYISRFMHRLQEHFTICYQTVSTEQSALYSKMAELDHKSSNLFRRVSLSGKKYENLTNDLKRVKAVNSQLESIQINLEEIVTGLTFLNEILPIDQRLPNLPPFHVVREKSLSPFDPADYECRVVDAPQ